MPLVNPHGGGELLPLLVQGKQLAAERARAATLPKVRVSSREKGDIIMLGIGGFTPLEGFMTHADWQGVCDGMKMANGLFWPIPITLSADQATADLITTGQDVALVDPDNGEFLATMKVTEKYVIDKAHECATVFKTTDPEHPGVKMVMEQADVNLAGPVKVLSTGGFPEKYGALFMTPAETRALFTSLGWSKIAAFQTRNPMHRSHEYLAKVAIEVCDGVLVHSLLGALKPGDIPAEVRTRAISVLAENISSRKPWCRPATRSTCAMPVRAKRCCMRCSGRTMAARTRSSGATMPASAATTARSMPTISSISCPKDALETQPLKIDWTFWCYKCGGMASARTCPHGDADRLLVSGTKLRKWLSEGAEVPAEFSRPEVLAILREYYASLDASQNVEVKLTGHSAR